MSIGRGKHPKNQLREDKDLAVQICLRACAQFADTDQLAKETRDPVAPATRYKSARTKATTQALSDGAPAPSFSTLMAELATIVRNTCRTPSNGSAAPTFEITTIPNPKQRHTLALIENITL